MSEQAMQAPTCEHYYAWVSPAGAKSSARLCMSCHLPDPAWLNETFEVHPGLTDPQIKAVAKILRRVAVRHNRRAETREACFAVAQSLDPKATP